ncbi:MAG: glycosyltransferase [Chloroflexi bacterium]|nr:glycosyltransferase [Chloroflexota bacterium]
MKMNSYFPWIIKNLFWSFVVQNRLLEQYAPRPLTPPKAYTPLSSTTGAKPALISIVTPSYNQSRFVERAIRSVFDQNYPNLEYVVQDGGSDDGSVELIKSLEHGLTYFESRKDMGQAHALNLGFSRTSGEIMGYLNSDDTLLPGTLWYVADYFNQHPDVDVVYGHRIIINENDEEIGRWILPPHSASAFLWIDYIPQETLFWRRRIWEKVSSQVDESFSFAVDWDLLIRFYMAGAKFVRVPRFLGAFRAHPTQKTSIRMKEIGAQEMKLLRARVHKRDVRNFEITINIVPYLLHSFIYHLLYKVGILNY